MKFHLLHLLGMITATAFTDASSMKGTHHFKFNYIVETIFVEDYKSCRTYRMKAIRYPDTLKTIMLNLSCAVISSKKPGSVWKGHPVDPGEQPLGAVW